MQSLGFSGAACLSFTARTSSDTVEVSLQDQQSFFKNGQSSGPLASVNACNSSRLGDGSCQASGVLALNETFGTYFFLARNTAASTGWMALNYTLLSSADAGVSNIRCHLSQIVSNLPLTGQTSDQHHPLIMVYVAYAFSI